MNQKAAALAVFSVLSLSTLYVLNKFSSEHFYEVKSPETANATVCECMSEGVSEYLTGNSGTENFTLIAEYKSDEPSGTTCASETAAEEDDEVSAEKLNEYSEYYKSFDWIITKQTNGFGKEGFSAFDEANGNNNYFVTVSAVTEEDYEGFLDMLNSEYNYVSEPTEYGILYTVLFNEETGTGEKVYYEYHEDDHILITVHDFTECPYTAG